MSELNIEAVEVEAHNTGKDDKVTANYWADYGHERIYINVPGDSRDQFVDLKEQSTSSGLVNTQIVEFSDEGIVLDGDGNKEFIISINPSDDNDEQQEADEWGQTADTQTQRGIAGEINAIRAHDDVDF